MERITPFFKLNGVRYEIKRTRFILAEYDRLKDEQIVNDEDKALANKAITLLQEVRKYALKVEELEAIFFDTLDEMDERRYLKAKEYFNNAWAEYQQLDGADELVAQGQKNNIDLLETIAIIGLAENHFGSDRQKAQEVWEQFVDVKGQAFVIEWLSQMADSLFSSDEEAEQDDFLSAMRKRKQEQERNRQAGAKKK